MAVVRFPRSTTSRRAIRVLLTLSVALLPLASAAQVQLPIAATFDTSTEGWTLAPGEIGTVDHVASGGDPGGYVRFTDAVGVSAGHIVAPPRFHGDWSALEGVASLSWQHQIVNPGGGPTIGEPTRPSPGRSQGPEPPR